MVGGRKVTVIGIDWATRAEKTGLARARVGPEGILLLAVQAGRRKLSLVDQIVEWIDETEQVILAIDAPLGWPASLGEQLHHHAAGAPITAQANEMFRRQTDVFVEETIGKRPLEVGADRIARTAVTALSVLADLRERMEDSIPLAWSSQRLPAISAIEVYPAATLRSRGLRSEGYKGRSGATNRLHLFEQISQEFVELPDVSLIAANDDALDAVLCVLAGVDFLCGLAYRPTDEEVARKEGWIWFRRV